MKEAYFPGFIFQEISKKEFQNFMNKGKKDVEDYTEQLRQMLKNDGDETDIRLQWDKQSGLTNICIGTTAGLDLDETIILRGSLQFETRTCRRVKLFRHGTGTGSPQNRCRICPCFSRQNL